MIKYMNIEKCNERDKNYSNCHSVNETCRMAFSLISSNYWALSVLKTSSLMIWSDYEEIKKAKQ